MKFASEIEIEHGIREDATQGAEIGLELPISTISSMSPLTFAPVFCSFRSANLTSCTIRP